MLLCVFIWFSSEGTQTTIEGNERKRLIERLKEDGTMASWFYLDTPQVRNYKVYYPSNKNVQEKIEKLQPILDRWQDYCENGWLSENYEAYDCTENKIKRFLDSCGSMLLKCNDSDAGIISDYKQKKIWEHECSLDELLEQQRQIDEGYDIY